jgi:hypothetical protein
MIESVAYELVATWLPQASELEAFSPARAAPVILGKWSFDLLRVRLPPRRKSRHQL